MKTSQLAWFAVAVLGVFRVTHLLSAEDGPFDWLLRLRAFAGTSAAGKLLDCFYCSSLWVAAPFAYAIAESALETLLLLLGLSGGAIVLQRITTNAQSANVAPPTVAPYFEAPASEDCAPPSAAISVEESEEEHGMLWEQTNTASKRR